MCTGQIMHENQRYEIGLKQMQKVDKSSGIALFTPCAADFSFAQLAKGKKSRP
jgi:hypothetical protein